MTVSRTELDWQLTVTIAPERLPYAAMTLTLVRPDGTTNLSATPWTDLDVAGEGCSLQRADFRSTVVSPGDWILCRIAWYAERTDWRIVEGTRIILAGRFE